VKKGTTKTIRVFAIELALYTILVVTYFFLVLHLLGQWLYELEIHHRYSYAAIAILLIIGQAILLESLNTFLMRFIRSRFE
jgi:hypothetical protein